MCIRPSDVAYVKTMISLFPGSLAHLATRLDRLAHRNVPGASETLQTVDAVRISLVGLPFFGTTDDGSLFTRSLDDFPEHHLTEEQAAANRDLNMLQACTVAALALRQAVDEGRPAPGGSDMQDATETGEYGRVLSSIEDLAATVERAAALLRQDAGRRYCRIDPTPAAPAPGGAADSDPKPVEPDTDSAGGEWLPETDERPVLALDAQYTRFQSTAEHLRNWLSAHGAMVRTGQDVAAMVSDIRTEVHDLILELEVWAE